MSSLLLLRAPAAHCGRIPVYAFYNRNRALRIPPGFRWLDSPAEVSEYLVVSTVFKTAEPESLGLAGSIPVHLRQATNND